VVVLRFWFCGALAALQRPRRLVAGPAATLAQRACRGQTTTMAAPAALIPAHELVQSWATLMAGTLMLNWATRTGYRRLFISRHGTDLEPCLRVGCGAISVAYGALALNFTYGALRLLVSSTVARK
jgi:hypothetical protein